MNTKCNKEEKYRHISLRENLHDMAKDLYDAGVIDAKTMRRFDEKCLPKVKDLSPAQIKKLRLREKASQPLFVRHLNTSPSTVKQWEQGLKHPSGIALKLLNVVEQKGLAGIS